MAESILDLTGHNPWSRLNFSEFKNLEGLRRSLVRRLKTSPEYRMLPPELSPKKTLSASNNAEDGRNSPSTSSAQKSHNNNKPATKVCFLRKHFIMYTNA